jgi:hypothetical protein
MLRARISTMRVTTCPTATIRAPAPIVWRLLTDPDEYSHWGLDLAAIDPPGALRRGQRLRFRTRALGRTFLVDFDVLDVREAPHRALRLDVHLPFGVVNHELVTCAVLGPESCFVSFN